jgi:hypothetical protein
MLNHREKISDFVCYKPPAVAAVLREQMKDVLSVVLIY